MSSLHRHSRDSSSWFFSNFTMQSCMIASVSICSLKSSPINLMFPMERLRALSFASFSSSCSLSRSLAWKWEWEEDKSEMIAVSAAVKSASFCLWRIEVPRQQMEIIFRSPYSNFILSSVFISLIKLIQFNCKKKCNTVIWDSFYICEFNCDLTEMTWPFLLYWTWFNSLVVDWMKADLNAS